MGDNRLREDLLTRRMAWRNVHNLEDIKPNGYRDIRDNCLAVKMLTCIGCMNYLMLYIEDDLVDLGKFRHNIKHIYRRYSDDVRRAHGEAYKLLNVANITASKMYNDYVDYYFNLIWDGVLLEGIEKSMNILYTLSRLVEKYNGLIRGRYDFAPSIRLYGAKDKFNGLGVKDYSLDLMIERIIDTKMCK